MDYTEIRVHLALAEDIVLVANERLIHQRSLVARMDENGTDATLARHLLRTFEESFALHLLHCDRLRAVLEASEDKGVWNTVVADSRASSNDE
jgi:site-specific recombinase XerC